MLDLRGTPPKTPITADRIGDRPLHPMVLLHTGWARHYGTPAYFDHPFLHPDTVLHLLGSGVRTFCIDAPSIDPTPDTFLRAHLLIADAGSIIGENFRNLDLVDWSDPFVSCLPIKLAGADGAPVRAVARGARPRWRPAARAGTALTPTGARSARRPSGGVSGVTSTSW